MSARAKTIQIFLPTGDPRGLRIAEIATRIVFAKDHLFGSPSTAASALLWRSANGWIEWKLADGRTLDQVHRSGAGQ